MMRSFFLAFAACLASATAAAQRPNIVFIFSDDHALNAISAYGGPLAKAAPTPNIDRLANQGAIFANSFCANSICGPSRACIQTGLHSAANGFLDNDFSTFDGNQRTFPKLLQKAGYQTALIGKWHLVTKPQGFDYWEILPGQGHYYNPEFITPKGTRREEGYVSDLITDKAITWLDSRKDKSKPFLLMAQHKAPHRNWSAAPRHLKLFSDTNLPEPASLFDDYANRAPGLKTQRMTIAKDFYWGHDAKFEGKNLFPDYFEDGISNNERARMTPDQQAAWDAAYRPENEQLIADIQSGKLKGDDVTRWKYQRYIKDYLRCVRAVDESVGKILDHLDKSGLADNTIVIYSSDQGFYLGEHGWYDKRWMFEESMKMPFLIRWPSVVKPGTRPKALIQNIDYAPTFLEAAGLEVPADMHGKSLLPVLKGGDSPPEGWRDAVYYFYSGENTHRVVAHDGVRTQKHKLIWFPDAKVWNLFDLEKDPQEMRSVHDDPAYASILADLQKKYAELRGNYGINPATIPQPRFKERNGWWTTRHEEKVKEIAQGGHELVFLGDSITQGWEGAGKETWARYFAPRKAVNLGFSGDRTEHALWRLFNGEFTDAKPKVLVLMLGTNNTGHSQQPGEETVSGLQRIVSIVRDRTPDTKILLLGIFPRGQGPEDPLRKLNEEINRHLAKMDDGNHIHFLDIGDKFLAPDGQLPADIMPDKLHLSPKGYEIWAQAMEAKLSELGKWQPLPGPSAK